MKKVKVVELVDTVYNEIVGYTPIIEEKGMKSKMLTDKNGMCVKFQTRSEAKTYGLEFIEPKN